MKRGRWAAGVLAAVAVGAVIGRTAIRRERRRADLTLAGKMAELPPEDLGPVRSFDGTPLAVRGAGEPSAPVLVFVHGLSGDLTLWHEQWTALSGRFRCVLYDQRGHGQSGRPESGDYSLGATGRDLRAVLDAAVGEGPAVLVGHTMGGMAILALAGAHPEEFGSRVAGVVLAATAAGELVRGAVGAVGARVEALLRPGLRAALGSPVRAERMRRLVQRRGSDLAYAAARLTNFGPRADPSLVEYVTGLAMQAPVEVWTDALVGLIEMDLREALRNITVPVLVLVGERDRLTPPASARAMARELPDARLGVVRGAGHLLMLERPEQFNRAVARLAEEVVSRDRQPARR